MPTNQTFSLSSSLRLRTAEQSLDLVRPLALERGISRVVDTTWLDRLGIPVYAAIRPNALKGSLNVHAGKGFTHAEAKIGAYMEAIEFSFAELGRNHLQPSLATPLDILASFRNRVHFTEFCPAQASVVKAEDVLGVVEAEEILGLNHPVLLPAELVYFPYIGGPGLHLYGSSTNGLASGNTVQEATVHGLAEVMERHVDSFTKVGAPSYLVDLETLPPRLAAMVERFKTAGLEFYLRYSPNEFGLAHFTAYAMEEGEAPVAMVGGVGFHCNSDIAAVRAIAEAAQSRLTTIHGGRDDLLTLHLISNELGREQEAAMKQKLRRDFADSTQTISFADVPDMQARTIDAAFTALTDGLRRAGMNYLARVVMTPMDCPFQVVRVVVPGAEFYDYHLKRVGPRLLAYSANKESTASPATSTELAAGSVQ